MSDQENKNPDTIDVQQLHTEWSRLSGNPDNLIVSDSLRGSLPDEFSESENVSSILEVAVGVGGLDIVAPLTRLDITRTVWLCQLSVDASDAAVLLSFSLEEIQASTIEVKDKGNTIKTLEVTDADDLALSVDTDGQTYFITLSCEKNQEVDDEA